MADTIDEVSADCESVTRQFVSPPKDDPIGDDRKRPRCQVGGSTSQRIKGRRRLRVAATSNEIGEIAASGFISLGGINVPIRPQSKRVTVAGGGVELKFKFTRSLVRKMRRSIRKRRKLYARMKIVATDRAGNTSRTVHMKIRIR